MENGKSEVKHSVLARRTNWVWRIFQPHFRFFNFLHFPGRQLRPFVFIFAGSRRQPRIFQRVDFSGFPATIRRWFSRRFSAAMFIAILSFRMTGKFNSLTAYINTPYKLFVYNLKFSRFKVLMLCFLDSELWRNERLCYGDNLIHEIRRIWNSRLIFYTVYVLLYFKELIFFGTSR